MESNSTGTTSLPVPSMATIPLPPGLSLDQYLTLQGQLGRSSLVVLMRAPDKMCSHNCNYCRRCNGRYWLGLVSIM